ncbi:MAG TPA: DUF481 domain-containing protein [Puia sp.]|nr:DUF481 domain-containing protein [Puia sp.]
MTFLLRKVSAQQRDSIFLYNGQVLIGEIQEATLGVITIDDIDLKLTNVKLYKIKTLKIYHRFKIETIDKKLYRGRLRASGKDGWIDILPDEGGTITIPTTSISQLFSYEKDFFRRVHGILSAGFSYSKSSNIGQLNLSASVKYATRLLEFELSASELASIDSSKLSRDNEDLQLFTNYDLTPVWFLAAIGEYQRNLELSIARRYIEMLGGGNKLFVRKDWQLLAITGLNVTQERSTVESQPKTVSLEVPVMLRFNYYRFSHPDIQISCYPTIYFSLTEPGRIRFSGNTNFSWQIIRYFYLNFNPYSNFDSKPPSGTSGSKFDYGIVLSISYKF